MAWIALRCTRQVLSVRLCTVLISRPVVFRPLESVKAENDHPDYNGQVGQVKSHPLETVLKVKADEFYYVAVSNTVHEVTGNPRNYQSNTNGKQCSAGSAHE
jgi:hypothetical protein